ncbi:MAG TPA: hypothetical protein PLX02_12625 [Syntrophorhabdaceae bacterium]|nr:hypothetical protein [Syntrophorhabdaceae bacterium]HQM81157.1 hypothetical protein [Syntrophorhabdaceae bacterium]HQM82457.1 hypothetical protein [Syntrophorhabdaceae bacterium]
MKRLIIISLIIFSGIIFYSCAATCPIIIPPTGAAEGQAPVTQK